MCVEHGAANAERIETLMSIDTAPW